MRKLCVVVLLFACRAGSHSGVPLNGVGGSGNNGDQGQGEGADQIAPTVSLSDPAALVRGGDTLMLQYAANDDQGVVSLILEFAADGDNFAKVADLDAQATAASWTAPTADADAARLRLTASDAAGNHASATSKGFHIDATPPDVTAVSLASPATTNQPLVVVAVADCRDRSLVYLSDGNGSPVTEPCTTTPGALTISISGEGAHGLNVWFSDAAGNVSTTKAMLDVVLDTTPPLLALTSFLGGQTYRAGSLQPLTWTLSDANLGLAPLSVDVSSDSGATFQPVVAAIAAMSPYGWTLPALDSTTVRVRLSATDAAGNVQSVVSPADFALDATPPLAAAVTLASATPTTDPAVTLTVADCADRASVYVNEAGPPDPSAPGWQSCTTAAGATTATVAGDGSHALHVWFADAVGNVSATATTVSMLLDVLAPSVTLGALTGGQTIAGGVPVPLTWTATDNDFGATPITLEYSIDSGAHWLALAGPLANTGSYPWTPPSADSTTFRVRVKAQDNVGHTTIDGSAADFSVDSTAPQVQSLVINGGLSVTTVNFVQVSLSAHDTMSNVTHFCLRTNDNTKPTSAAACFIPVNNPSPGITPAPSITFSGFSHRLGFTPGIYTVYAWVRDAAGNVSALSALGAGTTGIDKASIQYKPGVPPVVVNATATSIDNPCTPQTQADVTVAPAGDAYVKWDIQSAPNGLDAGPIDLLYTTDDTTYTAIAQGIDNVQGAGCTLTPAANGSCTTTDTLPRTGCYLWHGAPAGYFRVRVRLTDHNGTVTLTPSNSVNAWPPLNFLAGNTEPGLGGSATNAIFFTYNGDSAVGSPHTLAVSEDGVIYYLDVSRGVMRVDFSDGVQRLLLPTTGSATGDGGPVTSATLARPTQIAIDYAKHLLIYDYDRIRRVDLAATPMTIDTFIGGGAAIADGVPPTTIQVAASSNFANARYAPFAALPNGDVYFQTADAGGPSPRIRVFHALANTVDSIYPHGSGAYSQPGIAEIASCNDSNFGFAFDPMTSLLTQMQIAVNRYTAACGLIDATYLANLDTTLGPTYGQSAAPHPQPVISNEGLVSKIVGKDGALYALSRYVPRLAKYVPASQSWTVVLGNGVLGQCADGTPATACATDLYDADISQQGFIYFVDHGLIRTVDESGNVVTLVGQRLSFGDGGAPLSARFNTLSDLRVLDSGDVVVIDEQEARLRRFTPGVAINTIAGNGGDGIPDTSGYAVDQAIFVRDAGVYWGTFAADTSNGDLYYNRGFEVAKLDHTSGKWVDIAGGGGTSYVSADNQLGNVINFPQYPPLLFGYDGTHAMVGIGGYDSIARVLSDSFLKLYDKVNGTQSALAGVAGPSPGDFCAADGGAGTGCGVPYFYGPYTELTPAWDGVFDVDALPATPPIGRWLLSSGNSNGRVRALSQGGNISTLTNLPAGATSFAYRRVPAGNPNDPADDIDIIYYCSGGTLHKHTVAPPADVDLAWPIASMSCVGRTLIYDAARDALVFVYQQRGLEGVAEYLSP